jgi:hypothetical protein
MLLEKLHRAGNDRRVVSNMSPPRAATLLT